MKSVYYILPIILFIFYLLSADYIFNSLIPAKNESPLVSMNVPNESIALNGDISSIAKIDLQWKEGVTIKGWVDNSPLKTKGKTVFLVLESDTESKVFKVNKNAIGKKNNFTINIPLYRLSARKYKIGLMTEYKSDTQYILTNDLLINEGGKYSSGLKNEITTSNKEKNNKLRYKFSRHTLNKKILTTNDNLIVRGWGFLNGQSARNQKVYVLLEKDGEEFIFKCKSRERKDITRNLKHLKLNLDDSGFFVNILTRQLEVCVYKLGLSITKNNKTETIYGENYIEIKDAN